MSGFLTDHLLGTTFDEEEFHERSQQIRQRIMDIRHAESAFSTLEYLVESRFLQAPGFWKKQQKSENHELLYHIALVICDTVQKALGHTRSEARSIPYKVKFETFPGSDLYIGIFSPRDERDLQPISIYYYDKERTGLLVIVKKNSPGTVMTRFILKDKNRFDVEIYGTFGD